MGRHLLTVSDKSIVCCCGHSIARVLKVVAKEFTQLFVTRWSANFVQKSAVYNSNS